MCDRMQTLVIYIHGKGGEAKEAQHYQAILSDSVVAGFDYKSQTPYEAKAEFSNLYDVYSKGYKRVILVANSIGAYLAMNALAEKKIYKALFISPIVDMERLIKDMMNRSNITEAELEKKREIITKFGEKISWEYLSYVRNNPILWNIPTCILYGGKDNLTSKETMTGFADRIGAALTIMEDGEHRLHRDEEKKFLDKWVKTSIS